MVKCIKCKKKIPDDSKFCNYCGTPQKEQKYYRRPDGLYEKKITVNGKRMPFRGKNIKEVDKKILEFNCVQEKGLPFNEITEMWEREHYEHLEYNTVKCYKPAAAHTVKYFGNTPIKKIDVLSVRKYLATFPTSWKQKTYKNHLSVLNLIFKYAIINGYLDNNPAEFIKPPKGLKKDERRAPTSNEIEIIKNNIDKPFGVFAFFLLYTGCRRGEALALRWKDINFKDKTITVSKSVYHVGNSPNIKKTKTKKSEREIPLLDILEKELKKIKGKKSHYVFGEKDKPLTNKRVYNAWKKYRETVGLDEEVTPHVARHGFATICHEAGINIKDAQALLGHADYTTTANIYTHVSDEQMKRSADKLNTYTMATDT